MSFKNYNFNKERQRVLFDFHNTPDNQFDVSYINAFRRVCIAEIDVVGIDRDSINVFANTSVIHNDMLTQRLELCPINNKEVSKYDIENIEFSLDVKNDSELKQDVFLNQVTAKDGDKQFNSIDLFPYPDILLTKLKVGQVVSLTFRLHRANTISAGSAVTPVTAFGYEFEHDEDAIKAMIKERGLSEDTDIEQFMFQHADRLYRKTNVGTPLIYNLSIESVGMIDAPEIALRGFNKLLEKLDSIHSSIVNGNLEHVEIKKAIANMDAYEFFLKGETDTMAHLLQSYMLVDPDVKSCGYYMVHPWDKVMIIKSELKKDNNLDANKKKMLSVISSLQKITGDLISKWKSFAK